MTTVQTTWVGRIFIGAAACIFLLTAFHATVFTSVSQRDIGFFLLAIGLIF